MVRNQSLPEYQGYLRHNCVTIAEALRAGAKPIDLTDTLKPNRMFTSPGIGGIIWAA